MEHEYDLVEHISNFIKTRIEMTKAVDMPPEISVRKDLWELLTKEEKDKRTKDYDAKQKAKTDAKAKENDALALSLFKLDVKKLAEINTIILDNFIKEDQESFQEKKKVLPLTAEQKREIFKSVRYSFMTH